MNRPSSTEAAIQYSIEFDESPAIASAKRMEDSLTRMEKISKAIGDAAVAAKKKAVDSIEGISDFFSKVVAKMKDAGSEMMGPIRLIEDFVSKVLGKGKNLYEGFVNNLKKMESYWFRIRTSVLAYTRSLFEVSSEQKRQLETLEKQETTWDKILQKAKDYKAAIAASAAVGLAANSMNEQQNLRPLATQMGWDMNELQGFQGVGLGTLQSDMGPWFSRQQVASGVMALGKRGIRDPQEWSQLMKMAGKFAASTGNPDNLAAAVEQIAELKTQWKLSNDQIEQITGTTIALGKDFAGGGLEGMFSNMKENLNKARTSGIGSPEQQARQAMAMSALQASAARQGIDATTVTDLLPEVTKGVYGERGKDISKLLGFTGAIGGDITNAQKMAQENPEVWAKLVMESLQKKAKEHAQRGDLASFMMQARIAGLPIDEGFLNELANKKDVTFDKEFQTLGQPNKLKNPETTFLDKLKKMGMEVNRSRKLLGSVFFGQFKILGGLIDGITGLLRKFNDLAVMALGKMQDWGDTVGKLFGFEHLGTSLLGDVKAFDFKGERTAYEEGSRGFWDTLTGKGKEEETPAAGSPQTLPAPSVQRAGTPRAGGVAPSTVAVAPRGASSSFAGVQAGQSTRGVASHLAPMSGGAGMGFWAAILGPLLGIPGGIAALGGGALGGAALGSRQGAKGKFIDIMEGLGGTALALTAVKLTKKFIGDKALMAAAANSVSATGGKKVFFSAVEGALQFVFKGIGGLLTTVIKRTGLASTKIGGWILGFLESSFLGPIIRGGLRLLGRVASVVGAFMTGWDIGKLLNKGFDKLSKKLGMGDDGSDVAFSTGPVAKAVGWQNLGDMQGRTPEEQKRAEMAARGMSPAEMIRGAQGGPNFSNVASGKTTSVTAAAKPQTSLPTATTFGGKTGKELYAAMAEETARRFGIDPQLFKALVWQESRFNPKARSIVKGKPGAIGLSQVMPATGREMGYSEADLWDPQKNLEAGATYFSRMLKMFGGDPTKALAAYNAGPGAVKRAGGVPNFKETRNYVSSIMSKYGEFQAASLASQKTPTAQAQASASPGMARGEFPAPEEKKVDVNVRQEDVVSKLDELINVTKAQQTQSQNASVAPAQSSAFGLSSQVAAFAV